MQICKLPVHQYDSTVHIYKYNPHQPFFLKKNPEHSSFQAAGGMQCSTQVGAQGGCGLTACRHRRSHSWWQRSCMQMEGGG